jgi:hypothetical protein
MGILDEINNMRNQGMGEREIITNLQERGVKPRSIEEALNQMRIKKAVSAESSGHEGMEPSIMNEGKKHETNLNAPLYIPKTQEIGHEQEEIYAPSPPQFPQFNEELEAPVYGNQTQEEYLPQEGYGNQGAGSYDADTLIEIAEQVFSEKIKKEQKQIASLNEFATLAETKISNDHERIKRIEMIIDKLQAAILEKVGSYGRNLDIIKNEMGMMQESFGKMVPSLHEHNQHHHERSHEQPHHEEHKERQLEHEMNLQQQHVEPVHNAEHNLHTTKKISKKK